MIELSEVFVFYFKKSLLKIFVPAESNGNLNIL